MFKACATLLLLLVAGTQGLAGAANPPNLATYHYDNYRTGWNSSETTLSPANVGSLALKYAIALDEQVDAQPLYVNGIVYVVTENDTVYAINPSTGSVVASRNLGTPVPMSALPGSCSENSAVVGITSTPVIDPSANLLYLIAYTYESGLPVYRLHALDLSTLADAITPRLITASAQLSDGSTYNFNPAVSRQRAGLVLANGNVDAAFASFCDFATSQSRGWVLGWNASTLAPLTANNLVNRQASSAQNYFLSSVWMSGFGLAADPSGDLYFSTGNSDPSGSSYSTLNLEESVVRLSNDLTTVHGYLTPTNYAHLDALDLDVSAGGVLLFPDQYGGKNLAVALGKVSPLFLLDRDNLGGYDPSGDHVIAEHGSYMCSCGISYFKASDGIGRIIIGTNTRTVQVWKVVTSPSLDIAMESESNAITNGQFGGFMTSVSSNGLSNALIWAVSRPTTSSPAYVTLYAFDPKSLNPPVFTANAGTWPNHNGNANIVPVVVNGQVFVSSYKQLAIWGLPATQATGTQPTFPIFPSFPFSPTTGTQPTFPTFPSPPGIGTFPARPSPFYVPHQ
jgi:outer membrane protein assembly factor BamB